MANYSVNFATMEVTVKGICYVTVVGYVVIGTMSDCVDLTSINVECATDVDINKVIVHQIVRRSSTTNINLLNML